MNQKKLIIVTLVVVVAAAVTVNELVIRSKGQEQNREVASFGERYAPEQVKWEQELAKTVSRDSGKTLIGAKPTVSDKFLYEALAGQYEAQVVNGKILRISLLQNQEGLTLDTPNVLQKYSAVFKDANGFESKQVDSAIESVVLKNTEGRQIGHVTIRRNPAGKVVDIEIE
jgi:hypothetical protein